MEVPREILKSIPFDAVVSPRMKEVPPGESFERCDGCGSIVALTAKTYSDLPKGTPVCCVECFAIIFFSSSRTSISPN